jgi:uncharacterized protein (TIGR02147 family)
MMARVNVYNYLSAVEFLGAWLQSKQKSDAKFSLRSWARTIRITPAYLCFLLGRKRPLTARVLVKIIPTLEIRAHEAQFLLQIASYERETIAKMKEQLLAELARAKDYRLSRPRDSLLAEYLSDPLNVFIREMSSLDGFSADARFIQKRLWARVSRREIERRIRFLTENGFVGIDADGRLKALDVTLDCSAEVLRNSMSRFHRRMFEMASDAIYRLDRTRRNILGLVTPVTESQFQQIRRLLDDTMKKVQELTLTSPKPGERRTVMAYLGLTAFTLTSLEDQIHVTA